MAGTLRYPSDTGGWQLGDLDLSEYLDRYRDQHLVLIIAPVGEAEPPAYTCGICGFVMSKVQACPRCALALEEAIEEADRGRMDFLQRSESLRTESIADNAVQRNDTSPGV